MEVKNTAPAANACSANAEVFTKFMDVQTNQLQAASDMLSKAGAAGEKQNVLHCITMFQNNSMRALEAYFGNQMGAPVTLPVPAAPVVVPAPVAAPAPAAAPAAITVPTVEPVKVEAPKEEAPKVVETPKAAPEPVKPDMDVYAIITEAIADKTGYPTDMIDEDMELEADLGIDSIKRVEILSMVNTAMGSIFTKENVEELSGLSKIADMVAYLGSIAGSAPAAPAEPVVEAPAAPVQEATAPAVSDDKLSSVILEAIADKTGYPEDMIDRDMELEADLGIDSIKRVEIFAEVLKKLSITLTPDQTEELSTLSTVEAIAGYLSKLA